ncbi:MAG: GNAT family N-acetyltransferase [Clostridia bacterium]
MTFEIRQANIDDLDRVTYIEASCFPPMEAASKESFKQRIDSFPESFLLGVMDGEIVTMVNGCVTNSKTIFDELFHDAKLHNKENDYQSVFGLCTLPDYQKQGLAEIMLTTLIEVAQERGKKGVILTCKKQLIKYYEKFGFVNLGVSKSEHGGAVWYDMIIEF